MLDEILGAFVLVVPAGLLYAWSRYLLYRQQKKIQKLLEGLQTKLTEDKDLLYDPMGRRLRALVPWAIKAKPGTAFTLAKVLANSKARAELVSAAEILWMSLEPNTLIYIMVYEKLMLQLLITRSPLLGSLVYWWYQKYPGTTYIATELWSEIKP